MAEDRLEEEPGHPVPPGEPAIPINHTTPAGFLLAWPSIYRIVGPHLRAKGIKHITEYPISHEQNQCIQTPSHASAWGPVKAGNLLLPGEAKAGSCKKKLVQAGLGKVEILYRRA
ncbi:glycoside hydrolase family 76 [Metarhizium robertsii ARSEF 23]|uniref:Glycoside hydrolase family 76 n=1 Tax=Metarhizium robertsii (strain ARSEF 23 / ATCC MYA-3075) TaxID=655844 RepID=A0A0B2XFD0_METRA|nr:glycoside hydrolase family 76 [Metarhizium robertsii ARSEF 23]KHO10734.1 glycoside hydrolase family 76 [Metarhizium robertsii ARSEF 23]